ncbi:MAG: ABC transporter ATP-binding protein [Rhodoferax sp.]|uniref:ABC transporter ATP-binding protein n=1 Tax=Rhodoferax sp. TaxID=50421 RepID=UPI002721C3F9|nr:ABC transporter ATP-binding protein [Rhodoferax sp.]MDO8451193.1 ABC transporter ATP-binding protein [Rhodoferax sp.]
MNAIELKGVGKRFGDFQAVGSVDLAIPPQQHCALLGPNGAGKTTLLNLISGRLSLSSGSILINGHDVSHEPAGKRARLGVGRSFQKTNIFPQLSLLENVRLGLQALELARNWSPWSPIDADDALREQACAMLQRVDIRRPVEVLAEDLSYGEQRQLELAITLATQPRIVLLDEPTAGMSPPETAHVLELMMELLQGLTVVIVEHDLSVVDRIADRIVVLERGAVIADGTPTDVKADSRVQHAYLKGATHA